MINPIGMNNRKVTIILSCNRIYHDIGAKNLYMQEPFSKDAYQCEVFAISTPSSRFNLYLFFLWQFLAEVDKTQDFMKQNQWCTKKPGQAK